MNVGITRAKSSFLVVGSTSTLTRGDEHWKNLVKSAEKRETLFEVSKSSLSFLSDKNLESKKVDTESSRRDAADAKIGSTDDAAVYNAADADQGQAGDNGYGDGQWWL